MKLLLSLFLFFQLEASQTPMPKDNLKNQDYVLGEYAGGRLGNQFFQIAAALSISMDNGAVAVFPDYAEWQLYGIPLNYKKIFFRLNTTRPNKPAKKFFQEDPNFNFQPIPYTPNMVIKGFFQSEDYFKHNKDKILPYFEPSRDISKYVKNKFSSLINHPFTVAVHLRAFKLEDISLEKMYVTIGLNYVEKAASLFEDGALFVIFSDNTAWAKENLKDFSRPHIFIEGENYLHEFFLMSYLKHQIISNSTFSWWAAYLNKNPSKVIVAPYPWLQPGWPQTCEHMIPEDWIRVDPF